MSRGALVVVVSFVWACCTSALAQAVPAPPAAYAAASLGADLVLEPLATAAEADLGRGEVTLALARASLVVSETPASTSVHVRAEGLVLLAQQRQIDAAPAPAIEDVLAPLVDTASSDVTASRFELARARLTWVLARVPASSPLGVRATAIGAALDARAASATTTTARPSSVVVVPAASTTWTPPTPTAPEPASPPVVADPRRRADTEIVDLYITGGVMGAYLGAWVPVSSGALSGMADRDANLALAGSIFVGAGVLTLGVFGLDQIGGGLRSGQPDAIAQGIRFGFGLSALSLGVLAADHSYGTGEVFDALGIGLLGGAALGAIGAFALEPHPSQTEFTQTAGLWGAILGAELGAFVAPLAFPNFGDEPERLRTGFGLPLAGLSVGILTGIAISAAHEHFSSRRSWLTTLGMLAGTGAGSLVWTIISVASANFDVPTWGATAGVGSIGGLILAIVLTANDNGPRDFETPVQLSVSPTLGGATLGISGGF